MDDGRVHYIKLKSGALELKTAWTFTQLPSSTLCQLTAQLSSQPLQISATREWICACFLSFSNIQQTLLELSWGTERGFLSHTLGLKLRSATFYREWETKTVPKSASKASKDTLSLVRTNKQTYWLELCCNPWIFYYYFFSFLRGDLLWNKDPQSVVDNNCCWWANYLHPKGDGAQAAVTNLNWSRRHNQGQSKEMWLSAPQRKHFILSAFISTGELRITISVSIREK